MKRHDVGETTTIDYISKGEERSAEVIFLENPEIMIEKMDDDMLVQEQKAFLSAWIGED